MDKKAIYNTKKQLINKNLGGALESISPLLADYSYSSLHERIIAIKDDYKRMLSYMRQGFPDPSRSQLYLSLLRKLDRLTNDAAVLQRTIIRTSQGHAAPPPLKFTHANISDNLQDFVSELALSGLDMSSRGTDVIHAEHHHFMSKLFKEIC